jgi:DNA-binding transcriptional LysR family regulator
MELRHLRYFTGVAEALNFRKAAEALHISQPPLSSQIQDLEYELGVKLFLRSKQRISLTDAGKAFLPRAKAILQAAEKAKIATKLAADGKLGFLSIRFISSAVTGTLQKIVSSYKKAYPHVELGIEQSNVEAILKDVRDRKIDLGFVRTPVQLENEMIAVDVLQESYYVALPAGHKLSNKSQVSPKDLREEKLIIYPRNTASGSYDDILLLFSEQNIVPEIVQEAVEQLTIAGLVATGMGYSVVPECMTKIKVPGVIHLPLKGGKNRTGMAIVAKKPLSAIASTFIKEAQR